jgi:antitoxin component of MazEF toxin-antitoxin module
MQFMETDILSIRKIGGSLYFRLPAYHVHKFHLKPGDRYEFISNADGTFFKLIKVDDAEEIPPQVDGRRRQDETVAAE